jgi:hypothetical protein
MAECLISSAQEQVFLSLGILFNPEHGGSTFLQNVGSLLPDYTMPNPGIHMFLPSGEEM